ncbi:hypothetical protein VZ94_12580 [Methylocucumis oryzae]|uniref:Uncharacterized protein n=1 Tax=Methylocucumis oryzae TaxID=1632867 RepID=A0A0F3IHM7_9GAMM|nr:hypothetical protein VZ94_12580 [Methylocucumis oryzae]
MAGAKVDDTTHHTLFTGAEFDRNTLAENKVRVDAFFCLRLFIYLSSKTYSIFSPISAKVTASNSLETMLKDFCTTTYVDSTASKIRNFLKYDTLSRTCIIRVKNE